LHIKKVTTRDYAIVKRIIYIWDRIMNRFRYNIELWKQYLSFCYIINSKKHFFKVVTKALSFNPFNIELWLAAALYELEKAHNPIKARKIFY
jgi:U3 small nucleolar RNA-associated protein 6